MDEQGTVRIGVIGLGWGRRAVAPAFESTEGCRVVGLVSPRDEAAVDELCARKDVDLISIHSPPFLHVDHVRRAVAGGHAVLVDKPFGVSAEQGQEMLDLAREAGVLHLVNYEFRAHPVRVRLREEVRKGTVGPVEQVQISQVCGAWPASRAYDWSFDAVRGGGWVRVAGSHYIDFLRWTFGEIVEASAVTRTTVSERLDAEGSAHACSGEDAFVATMRTERDVWLSIDATATASVELPSRLTVIGRDGALEVVYDSVHEVGGRIFHHTREGSRQVARVEPWRDIHSHDDAAMTRWAPLVRDALRGQGDEEVLPSFADGLACSRVMDALTGTV